MFRVVPDQLRISEGWVRCGQCDEVFDANAHLRSLEEPQPVGAPEPQPNAPTVVEPLPSTPTVEPTPVEAPNASYDWGPLLEPQSEQSDTGVATPQVAAHSDPQPAPQSDRDSPPTADAQPEPMGEREADAFLDHSPHDLPVSEESQAAPYVPAAVDDWVYPPLAPDVEEPVAVPEAAEDAVPSFMPRSPQPAWGDRYLGRKLILSVMPLLVLLLGAQILLGERDRLAVHVPTLRPLLSSACAVLGCTLSAPRQIESIAIDSSSFTHVKSGVYNLSVSLRNGAAIDLAAPALELTLTDMQDQPLLRRVLQPGEYSAKTLIGAGAELVAHIPIAVRAGVATEKISGYKLLAFYP